jgi:hypothetical protein
MLSIRDVIPNFKRSIDADEILRVKKKYNLPDRYLLNVGTIEERKNLIVLVTGNGTVAGICRDFLWW